MAWVEAPKRMALSLLIFSMFDDGDNTVHGVVHECTMKLAMQISLYSAQCYRYSLLPTISMTGVLSCKAIESSFTTPLFKGFLEGLLNKMQPYPTPNSVIVMDNTKVHRSLDICETIEAQYASNYSNPSLC
jgi:hypothetical protein